MRLGGLVRDDRGRLAYLGSPGLAVAYGIGSAGVVGLIGLIYSVPLLLVSFGLVFGRVKDVHAEWLLGSFATAWFVVLLLRLPMISNAPEDTWPLWVSIGLVPALLAVAFRFLRHDRR